MGSPANHCRKPVGATVQRWRTHAHDHHAIADRDDFVLSGPWLQPD
jgi:hypothetical protein